MLASCFQLKGLILYDFFLLHILTEILLMEELLKKDKMCYIIHMGFEVNCKTASKP